MVDLIERWFEELADKCLRRDVYTTVDDRTAAATTWADHCNEDLKPFIWKAAAHQIIDKVRRGRASPSPDQNADAALGVTRD